MDYKAMADSESSKRKPLIIGIAGGTGGKDTMISNTSICGSSSDD